MPLQAARAANMRRQRLIRHVRAVHRLGERATFELVDEIARALHASDTVSAIAEKLAGTNPDLLRALGGDSFPAAPLRIIGDRT
jgi:hypothetical protein